MLLLVLFLLLRMYYGLLYSPRKAVAPRCPAVFMGGNQASYSSNEEVSTAVDSLQMLVFNNEMNEVDFMQFVTEKLVILRNTLKNKRELFHSADVSHIYWCVEKFCQVDSIAAALLQDSEVCNAIEFIDSVNDNLKLPFKVLHKMLHSRLDITMNTLLHEIPFKNDILKSKDGKLFTERRKTCWMVEEHSNIGGLAYSGKIMPPIPMSPTVASINNILEEKTGMYFDCVLINYYQDGECSCAWHQDPDMGVMWSTDSVIVSFGETRKFSLRKNAVTKEKHFVYPLENLDGFLMFGTCNGPTGTYSFNAHTIIH